MHTIWLIARYEYARHVRRRSFVLMALGVPLLMLGIIGLIILVASRSTNEARLGLIDQTGRFAAIDVTTLDLDRPIPQDVFPDETAARQALDARAIAAYIVIPADYIQTGNVRAVAPKQLSDQAEDQLQALLRAGLLAEAPPDAPWRAAVEQALAREDAAATTSVDAAASDPAPQAGQAAMIEGMVDGLAERLKSEPDDVEGWLRLIRSYVVLGRPDEAAAAARDALEGVREEASRERVEALIADLGVTPREAGPQ